MAPPPPPELVDDAVEEILLRLPPADPALLLRAALVCKRWRRIVSGPAFRRRFREFHRSAPMLGIFCQVFRREFTALRFFPTPASSCPPLAECRLSWSVLDSRHGRVLVDSDFYSERSALVVWDPISDEQRRLPASPRDAGYSFTGALFCAGDAATGGTCEHVSCRHGPFVVVLVINNTEGEGIYAYMYSSETGEWSELAACPAACPVKVRDFVPGALVGNELYFALESSKGILRYDLGARRASVIPVPHMPSISQVFPRPLELHACAHGVGVLFITASDDLFTVDIKSRQVNKFLHGYDVYSVAPFRSFYTPDLGVASSGEGPGAGGSSA
ncbi:unnamed protein product [Urochloa humidicola]